jgi:hypothetical protein
MSHEGSDHGNLPVGVLHGAIEAGVAVMVVSAAQEGCK